MSVKQKLLQCLFCGNKTLMNNIAEHQQNWFEEDNGFSETIVTNMYSCPVCKKITFLETYSNNAMRDWDGNECEEEKIIYPINSFEGNYLPTNIKSAFESALKTKNINYTICLIAIRKTLEIICKTHGAAGKDLEKKIEDLSIKGIIPSTLKDASHLLRLFGNMAVHDEEYEAKYNEINAMIEFTEYILDYLYLIPAKIDKLQKQLDSKKNEVVEGLAVSE
jgi:hypothetical protein